MINMIHPSRNFLDLSYFCILYMFEWLTVQGFGNSVNKDLLTETDVLIQMINFKIKHSSNPVYITLYISHSTSFSP